MPDPVVGADPVEQHRPRTRPNRAVNTLPLSVRICSGTPCRRQRLGQRVADRPGGGPRARPSRRPRTGNGHRSRSPPSSPAIGQERPAHHVHLPQLHRPGPLPAPVVLPPPLAFLRLDQTMAHQRPIDRRPARQRRDPVALQLPRIRSGPHAGCARRIATTAPRAPAASDADTTPAATTGPPDHPAHRRRHTGAATHGPSDGPPHTGRATSVTDAPSSTSSTARYRCSTTPSSTSTAGSLRHDQRGRRRSETGAARSRTERECRPPTGTTVAHLPEPRPQPVAQEPERKCQA